MRRGGRWTPGVLTVALVLFRPGDRIIQYQCIASIFSNAAFCPLKNAKILRRGPCDTRLRDPENCHSPPSGFMSGTIQNSRRWRTWFTDAERQQWVHRPTNLVLLPHRKNSEASNYEFDVKKQKYFVTKSGVVPFALTTQILMETEWRPAQLEVRQKALLAALASLWRLD